MSVGSGTRIGIDGESIVLPAKPITNFLQRLAILSRSLKAVAVRSKSFRECRGSDAIRVGLARSDQRSTSGGALPRECALIGSHFAQHGDNRTANRCWNRPPFAQRSLNRSCVADDCDTLPPSPPWVYSWSHYSVVVTIAGTPSRLASGISPRQAGARSSSVSLHRESRGIQ
jgi:hypothetical protein